MTNETQRRVSGASLILGAIAIADGAYLTSARIATTTPVSGIGTAAHEIVGILSIAAVLGVATSVGSSTPKRALAWSAVVCAAAAGIVAAQSPMTHIVASLHAIFSHLFFVTLAATAFLATPEHPSASVPGPGFLRPLAFTIPAIIVCQIVLGTLYRHELIGVVPHIGIAMIVAFAALGGASSVLQNIPKPASLRRAAGQLTAAILTQVALGIATFVMLLLNVSTSPYFIAVATAHVLVGTLALAASIAFAVEIARHVIHP